MRRCLERPLLLSEAFCSTGLSVLLGTPLGENGRLIGATGVLGAGEEDRVETDELLPE